MGSESKKHDTDKLRYDLIPPECLESIAKILTFGADKYGANNWQGLEDFESRYYAALERHIQAWRMGEKIDPESGQPHLAHVACNAVFLLWKEVSQTK